MECIDNIQEIGKSFPHKQAERKQTNKNPVNLNLWEVQGIF